MTLQERLKTLRREIGLSQEAMGAQGFVSAPGWVKIENGQRVPSDKLILRLVAWLLKDHHVTVGAAGKMMEELLTLKYLSNRSMFVRKLARAYADQWFTGASYQLSEDPAAYRAKPRKSSPHPEKI